jgi:hypothetical protein
MDRLNIFWQWWSSTLQCDMVFTQGWGSSHLQWQASGTKRKDKGYSCSMSLSHYGTCVPCWQPTS